MKKQLVLFLALALCLGLTACGDTESDDTQSGYETVMDMDFLDGMWSIDGTAKLYFNSTEGFYAYRTRWGLGGRGEFELSEASGRPMIFFNGLLYNFLLRDDGNSFTLSADRFGRYGDDQHFDGVFYRDADFYTYTDMENTEFYEDEYSTFYVWYYDGVNRYLLGNDYTIGDDGLAYHDEDGLVYPAGWIPEEPYDPAVDWGANWMDNWDI